MSTSGYPNSKQKIVYGLNTPFFLQHDTNWPKVEFDCLIDNLLELGVEQVRIPLSWFHMVSDHVDSRLIWNNAFMDRYSEFLGSLPDSISILGVPLHAPRKIAREYFYNQHCITDQFLEFLSGVCRTFPMIRDWEIWNEPNAGDFYLSISEKNGHRPWRANEFLEHIMIPAAKFLRNHNRYSTICAPGFAENGIVGHKDREVVLSNRLPKTDEFRELQPKSGYGHFYFIPNFANEFLKYLSKTLQHEPALVDAIAYHPYPYWQIYSRKNKNLIESTQHLVSDFNNLVKKYSLNDLEIWITEVGARSLEMANKNQRNDIAQKEYLDDLYNLILPDSKASRIYWYKLIDKSFDLKQEKAFGLLDIWGNRKKSYYKLKSIQHKFNSPRVCYVDSFKYAADHDKGGLDPDEWEHQQIDNFAYCIPSDRRSFSGVMVYPGKGENASISWVNKLSFRKENSQISALSLDIDPDVSPTGAYLSFVLHDVSSQLEFLKVSYAFYDKKILVSLFVECHSKKVIQNCEYNFNVYPDGVEAVFISWSNEQVVVGLTSNETRFYRSFELDNVQFPKVYRPKFSVGNIDNGRSFVGLSNFKIQTEQITPGFGLLPNNDQQADTWTADKSPYSQIDQDEWVLRATNFKRNGFFVEVGGHDGISNSNTVLLERKYGWNGFIVEANPKHYRQVCQNRNCVSYNYAVFPQAGKQLEFVDAGAVGGLLSHLQDDIHTNFRQRAIDENRIIRVPSETLNALLERSDVPELIEYMSVDTEGSELEVLQSCDFYKWKVALITVEHGGIEEKRRKINKYMSKFGYQRKRIWFEDWFYQPDYINKINSGGLENVNKAFEMLPFERKTRLTEQLKRELAKDGFSNSKLLMQELVKDFYPDNIVAYINYSNYLLNNNRIEKAISVIHRGNRRFPRNQVLLKLGIETFAQNDRNVLLIHFLACTLRFAKNLLGDKKMIEIIEGKRDELVNLLNKSPNLKKKNLIAFEYLV